MESHAKQGGFTLIEMVTVIVLVGILAAVVAPRFSQPSRFESRSVSDQLISTARQAQQLAMSKATTANVTLITDNSNHRIRITYTESGSQTLDIAIPNNITITDSTTLFLKSGAANLAAQLSISISPNSRTVCIETTGYAHAC